MGASVFRLQNDLYVLVDHRCISSSSKMCRSGRRDSPVSELKSAVEVEAEPEAEPGAEGEADRSSPRPPGPRRPSGPAAVLAGSRWFLFW